MIPYQISFDSPWYLLLLILIPVVWGFSFKGLAALGFFRRWFWLALRSLVLVIFIFALAEVQWVRTNDQLTVIYLLDQSLSIPAKHRRAMFQYVNEAVGAHRDQRDRVGVVVFGRDAAIEIPPFDEDVRITGVESELDPTYTDLGRAMRLAQATFPEDASKRVVLVTDGNENLGNATDQAQKLIADGVGIDVVPIRYRNRGEVIVDRVVTPGAIRESQPFDLKVVLTNTKEPTGSDSGGVPGRLVIKRRGDGPAQVISEAAVELPPGKKVFTVEQALDSAGFYQYEARFVPDREEDDTMAQNNMATAFAQLRGRGRILLIEDHQATGEFEQFKRALKRQSLEGEELEGQKLDVRTMATDELFVTLDELQQFDAVILANVPREHFTDGQIQMLVRNTQQLGAGLVMLGGPNSFGAGGWANTELEKAMPVEFQIKSAKVVPRGALALIMHASEMAAGNHWQKKISEEALKALGPRDYCGVIHYDNAAGCKWLWNPGLAVVGSSRAQMLTRLGRMAPGDMPDFEPGLALALRGFARVPDAAVKHMIIISDGDPSPPKPTTVRALARSKITVSTVAVGTHGPAGSRIMQNIANRTGGKYYQVRNANALPKIFQREARRVAQPLIYENTAGFSPQAKFPHEMTSGIEPDLPAIKGFVMTSLKENPLVEVSLISPKPGLEKNRTILASWTYGLGRTVAFTTDAGARWAAGWKAWENYDKLFGQMIVWAMRPTGEEGKFSIATDVQDGQVRVIVNALTEDDQYRNFLDMAGSVVGPTLEPIGLQMEQVAPGRYVGSFPAQDSGSYNVTIATGKTRLLAGVNVPYSDEFRTRQTNEALLDQFVGLVPEGGAAGQRIEGPEGFDDMRPFLAVNPFRHDLAKATSSQPVWHLLVLVACALFFFDVFVRRVHVHFAWVPVVAGHLRDRILGRSGETESTEVMDRLKSSKAQVDGQLDQLRASTRFEVEEHEQAGEAVDLQELAGPEPPAAPSADTAAPPSLEPRPDPDDDSYTARLLRAKKKAWEQRRGGEDP